MDFAFGEDVDPRVLPRWVGGGGRVGVCAIGTIGIGACRG